jgi:predicted ribosomally synthesized peptide with nif11-like leader
MSQEQAKACFEKMKADEAFRAKVLAVADVAARTQLINAEGFACSAEEIKAVSAELSDHELDGVAGGQGGVAFGAGASALPGQDGSSGSSL